MSDEPQFLPSTEMLEEGVLCRLMRQPELLNNGCRIQPNDFKSTKRRKIARTMEYLHKKGILPDIINVVLRLDELGELDKIGGRYYLTGFYEYESIDIHGDLRRLHEQAIRRKAREMTIQLGQDISGLSLEETAQVLQEIVGIASDALPETNLRKIMPAPVDLWTIEESVRERPEDVISGLLPLETVMLLYGPPKTGKSLLLMNLAMHLAAGKPWHHLQISRQWKVLYVSAEGGQWMLIDRVAHLRTGEVVPTPESLALWAVPSFDIRSDADYAALEDAVDKWHAEIIIIDPLQKIHTADENDNQAMQAVMNQFRSLITSQRRSLILSHHARKSGDAARGASSILGEADSIVRLDFEDRKHHGRGRRLYFEDLRHAESPPDLYLTLDPNTLTFLASESEGVDLVVNILAEKGELTQAELKDAVMDRGGISRSRAYQLIKLAKQSGAIRPNAGGKKLRLKAP